MEHYFFAPLVILAVAWGQELIDQLLFAGQWNLPMGPGLPLWRILTAPFSHSGFGHLLSNSIVFLPLSWLVISRGLNIYLAIWGTIFFVNIPIATFWPSSSHGLSSVVYGLLGYLLFIGWFEKKLKAIIVSLLILWLYGSSLISLIPGISSSSVSWIGHFSGFGAGLLTALIQTKSKSE